MGTTALPVSSRRSDFRPAVGAPEEGARVDPGQGERAQDLLDNEALEGRAHLGVPAESLHVGGAQEGVEQAGIAQVDPRRLGEPLADVREVRGQPPQEEEALEDVEVAAHRRRRHSQPGGELALVDEAAVKVGQHGQQPREGGHRQPGPGARGRRARGARAGRPRATRHSRAPTGRGSCEGSPPAPRGGRASAGGGHLRRQEGSQVEEPGPAGQALGDSAHQAGGGAPQEQVPRPPLGLVDQGPEEREQGWFPLDLVDDNEPRRTLQGTQVLLGRKAKARELRRPLEVEEAALPARGRAKRPQRVDLPHCRGPRRTTAGKRRSRASRSRA